MLFQLLLGATVIVLSMAVIIGFITVAIRMLRQIDIRFGERRIGGGQFFALLAGAVLAVLAANTICVWLWAILFRLLEIFPTLEEAVYFAIVSFTTVGYGDVVAGKDWRVLSGFIAVNGLLAFGVFTAFLIEIIRELARRYVSRTD